MENFALCGQVVLNLRDGGSVICGLPPQHGGDHVPVYVDIRKTDKLRLIDLCRECGQNNVTNIVSRHDCGCYLDSPPIKKQSLFSTLWSRMKGEK